MKSNNFIQLRESVLSLLTDKNVGFLQTENSDEEFGALMAYSKAFKEVYELFNKFEGSLKHE